MSVAVYASCSPPLWPFHSPAGLENDELRLWHRMFTFGYEVFIPT